MGCSSRGYGSGSCTAQTGHDNVIIWHGKLEHYQVAGLHVGFSYKARKRSVSNFSTAATMPQSYADRNGALVAALDGVSRIFNAAIQTAQSLQVQRLEESGLSLVGVWE